MSTLLPPLKLSVTHPRKPQSRLFWYVMPLALGLHGAVLMLPIDRNQPVEKPESAPIKTVPLVKLSPSLIALPKPSLTKAPIVASTSKPSSSIPAAKKTSVAVPRSTATQRPKPTPSPMPAVKPTPTPSPDVFQLQGAIACDGIKDCYVSAETNGRSVSQTLKQQLQAQGYEFKPLELDDETGMKVYELSQHGRTKGYLHIIWTEQGTRSLRLPQPVVDRQALAAIAQLPI